MKILKLTQVTDDYDIVTRTEKFYTWDVNVVAAHIIAFTTVTREKRSDYKNVTRVDLLDHHSIEVVEDTNDIYDRLTKE